VSGAAAVIVVAIILGLGRDGSVDLSNGAVMALGNIVMTRLAVASGLNVYLAIG